MNKTLTVVALASCVTGACQAASPPPVPENLLACSKLQDATERVRCYDQQVAAMKGATAPSSASAPATPPPAPAAAPVRSTVRSTATPAQTTATAPPTTATPAQTTATPVQTTTAAASVPAPATTAAAPTQVPGSSQSGSAPAAAAGSEQSSQGQFGQEFLPQSARPVQSERERALLASITALQQVRPNTYYISLSNGQVWRQEGMRIMAFFRVGDDIRIEKATLGTYRMSTARIGAKNWVDVTRIQ